MSTQLLVTFSLPSKFMCKDATTLIFGNTLFQRVFGYLDQKIILELCKYMETKIVYAGNYLFKIGDADDSLYIVESGKINVYITDEVCGA